MVPSVWIIIIIIIITMHKWWWQWQHRCWLPFWYARNTLMLRRQWLRWFHHHLKDVVIYLVGCHHPYHCCYHHHCHNSTNIINYDSSSAISITASSLLSTSWWRQWCSGAQDAARCSRELGPGASSSQLSQVIFVVNYHFHKSALSQIFHI